MQFSQIRIARPTNNLEALEFFYCTILELPSIGSFKDHEGYDGIMIGLPGAAFHLEFTQYKEETILPVPTAENIMVLYFDNKAQYQTALQRCNEYGLIPVEPENPYWKNKSVSFEDPDGYRVVLFDGVFQ